MVLYLKNEMILYSKRLVIHSLGWWVWWDIELKENLKLLTYNCTILTGAHLKHS